MKCLNSARVICMAEHRSKHDTVGDVKVCVAGRQAFEIASGSTSHHRQYQASVRVTISKDFPVASVIDLRSLQIVLKYFVIRVSRIFFHCTDNHIRGDIARFVASNVIVCAVEEDPDDANYEILQDNLTRLRSMTDATGKSFEIVTLPMPGIVGGEQY